jgi:hypothetical protein
MKHPKIDVTALIDSSFDEWMEHIQICPICQNLTNYAGQLDGYERDAAFWKIGFKVALEMIDQGKIKMAYLNRDGSNN